jgi:hypothetical protein
MAGHWNSVNDPVITTGRQNHTPDFGGTSAQRIAYPTASLIWGDQWTETDTGLTYKWTTSWGIMGASQGSSSMVVATSYTLGSLQTLTLGSGVTLLII